MKLVTCLHFSPVALALSASTQAGAQDSQPTRPEDVVFPAGKADAKAATFARQACRKGQARQVVGTTTLKAIEGGVKSLTSLRYDATLTINAVNSAGEATQARIEIASYDLRATSGNMSNVNLDAVGQGLHQKTFQLARGEQGFAYTNAKGSPVSETKQLRGLRLLSTATLTTRLGQLGSLRPGQKVELEPQSCLAMLGESQGRLKKVEFTYRGVRGAGKKALGVFELRATHEIAGNDVAGQQWVQTTHYGGEVVVSPKTALVVSVHLRGKVSAQGSWSSQGVVEVKRRLHLK